MAKLAKPQPGESRRGFTLEREHVKADERRVELAFSSEAPYRRSFGIEVLGHEAKEVDLSRLADGTHPLLLNHDRDKQIGVVESARVDGDKVGRATVRFSKSALGEEIFQDVVDGIRSQVSVAYEVKEWRELKARKGDEDPTFRAVAWEPFEVSIVSIAADPVGAGVGRHKHPKEMEENKELKKTEDAVQRSETPPKPAPEKPVEHQKAEPTIDPEVIKRAIQDEAKAQQKRMSDILAIGAKFKVMDRAQKAIQDGTTVEQFRAQVMDGIEPPKAVGVLDAMPKRHYSPGEAFVRSDAYQNAVKLIRSGGKITRFDQMVSDTWGATRSGNASYERADFSSATESLESYDVQGGVPGILGTQPLRIAMICPQGTTTANTVRYMQEDALPDSVQDATFVTEGNAKPETTFNVSQQDASVRKLAVLGKVTDEMFADFEMMRGYVDFRLRNMVERLEDRAIISGTGVAPQITGILNNGSIQTEDASSSTTVYDAVYKAITKVRSVSFTEPDYVVIHPNDWRDLRLTKDSNGQYYGGGPHTAAYGSGQFSNLVDIWGVPAVITTSITEGTALVGAFNPGCQLFRREGLRVETTNSDDTDFALNVIAIRAEKRIALPIYRPACFCSVTNIA